MFSYTFPPNPCIVIVLVGDIPRVIEFMMYNPSALWYNVLTAITSTTGQIAIFYTIKRFGPVVFTIIMTTRQMMSIVLSTVLFGHQISAGKLLLSLQPPFIATHPLPTTHWDYSIWSCILYPLSFIRCPELYLLLIHRILPFLCFSFSCRWSSGRIVSIYSNISFCISSNKR